MENPIILGIKISKYRDSLQTQEFLINRILIPKKTLKLAIEHLHESVAIVQSDSISESEFAKKCRETKMEAQQNINFINEVKLQNITSNIIIWKRNIGELNLEELNGVFSRVRDLYKIPIFRKYLGLQTKYIKI